MKLNKQITSERCRIYDWSMAEDLLNKEKYSHRQLSLMKQENIRVAILKKVILRNIWECIGNACGYCFKFDNNCNDCSLTKRNDGVSCSDIPEWNKMMKTTTLKEFSKAHKAWCKKLGLWKKEWR